jgi:hypothetical protein
MKYTEERIQAVDDHFASAADTAPIGLQGPLLDLAGEESPVASFLEHWTASGRTNWRAFWLLPKQIAFVQAHSPTLDDGRFGARDWTAASEQNAPGPFQPVVKAAWLAPLSALERLTLITDPSRYVSRVLTTVPNWSLTLSGADLVLSTSSNDGASSQDQLDHFVRELRRVWGERT